MIKKSHGTGHRPAARPARGTRRFTIARIHNVVAGYYHIPPQTMLSASRKMRSTHPRMVAMCLARKLTKKHLKVIGRYFNRQDHTTVLNAIWKIARLSKKSAPFRQDLLSIMDELRGRNGKDHKLYHIRLENRIRALEGKK